MLNSKIKWCYYCESDTHNDAECWSTRPVGWVRPDYLGDIEVPSLNNINQESFEIPEFLRKKYT